MSEEEYKNVGMKVKEMAFPVAIITIMLIAAVLMYFGITGNGGI